MKVVVNKSQRDAWDATMRNEVGLQVIPGKTKAKRPVTRSTKERGTSKRINVHGGTDEVWYKRMSRLERLELTNYTDPLEKALSGTGEDGDSSDDDKKKRRKDKRAQSLKPKQHFLADVLMSEGACEFVTMMASKSARPAPYKACDVSGKVARYEDPLTGLRLHSRRSQALLREQVPSWLKATAFSPYWDAVRTVSED